jgi:hypothetical protein
MVRISQAAGLSLSLSPRPRAPRVKLHTPLRPVPCGSQGKETSVSRACGIGHLWRFLLDREGALLYSCTHERKSLADD